MDDQGHPVQEKFYKPGTTILLRCLVTNYRPDFPAPMWRKEESVVTDSDKTRWGEEERGRADCYYYGVKLT